MTREDEAKAEQKSPAIEGVDRAVLLFAALEAALAAGDARATGIAARAIDAAGLGRGPNQKTALQLAARSASSSECLAAALAACKPTGLRIKEESLLESVFFGGDDERCLAKLKAMQPWMHPDDWKIGRRGGWPAEAARCERFKTLEWMATQGLGFFPDSNEAIWRLFMINRLERAESALGQLLMRANLRHETEPILLIILSCMQLKIDNLSNAASASEVKARWGFADQIAAFDPLQHGAKELWELGGGDPHKMPRLAARVSAEWLRQTVAEADAKAMGEDGRAMSRVRSNSSATQENKAKRRRL